MVFLLLQSTGSRVHRLQQLWHTGLAAPQHMESPWSRDQTHVPCIGRQILIHWSTKEFQFCLMNAQVFLNFTDLVAFQVNVVNFCGTPHHQAMTLNEIMCVILVPDTEYMINK